MRPYGASQGRGTKRRWLARPATSALIVVSLAVACWVALHALTGESGNEVRLRLTEVNGIRVGTDVTYRGYSIGSVSRIALQPDAEGAPNRPFVVALTLRSSSQEIGLLHFRLQQTDLLKPRTIEAFQPALSRNTEAPEPEGCEQPIGFAPVCDSDASPVELARQSLTNANELLTELKATQDDLRRLIATATDAIDRVSAIVDETNLRRVAQTIDGIARATARVDEVIGRLDPAGIEASAKEVGAQAIEASRDVRRAAAALSEASQQAGIMSRSASATLEQILQSVEETAVNLEEVSARLRDDPSLVIRPARPPEETP